MVGPKKHCLTRSLEPNRTIHPGHEVIFTTIEDLTHDGRDRSLDYKLSSIGVPKGHRHGQVGCVFCVYVGT